jgi:hypothetical protein
MLRFLPFDSDFIPLYLDSFFLFSRVEVLELLGAMELLNSIGSRGSISPLCIVDLTLRLTHIVLSFLHAFCVLIS